MVTSKRRIETEQDRFGGFDRNVSKERSIFRNTESKGADDSRTFSRTTTREHDQIYTGRGTGRTEERIHVQPQFTRQTRSTKLKEEDLMPTIKTMAYAEPKKKSESRDALEVKTKVMLAVYMVLVVLLAAIVIGTGIVINSMSANITRLGSEIEASQSVITQQNIEIEKLNDPYSIVGKAKDPNGLNMTEASDASYTEIEIIPFLEETKAVEKESLFDKFCDFMQGLLGK